jgi:hypothetical protein
MSNTSKSRRSAVIWLERRRRQLRSEIGRLGPELAWVNNRMKQFGGDPSRPPLQRREPAPAERPEVDWTHEWPKPSRRTCSLKSFVRRSRRGSTERPWIVC